MGQLCIYLIPFASDFSGVCAAFYDLDCMSAICDASCCTSQYVYYDEPRWEKKVKPVLSCSIRNIDAVMGNDSRIVEEICHAAEEIDTDMISIIGTPVPAITGMDIEGMASEVEDISGRISFGFNTTGFSYYDKGLIAAGKAMIDRFARKNFFDDSEDIDKCEFENSRCTEAYSFEGTGNKKNKKKINIIGISPLDFGDVGNDSDFVRLLEDNGWDVICSFFMGITKDNLEKCPEADINLAVSAAGVEIAEYLKKLFGTPYVSGIPVGKNYSKILLKKVENAVKSEENSACENSVESKKNAAFEKISSPRKFAGYEHTAKSDDNIQHDTKSGNIAAFEKMSSSEEMVSYEDAAKSDDITQNMSNVKVLIVSDQVIGNSLRESLRAGSLPHSLEIDVVTFFTFKKNIAENGDRKMRSEADFINHLRNYRYDIIVGDPSIKSIPSVDRMKFIEMPHPAMSGVMYCDEVRKYCSYELCEEYMKLT